MALIIIDCGSGETCRNDKSIVRKLIDSLSSVDQHNHEVIIKWQLWSAEGISPALRLDWDIFDYAYVYADDEGYQTTASVFDIKSYDFLVDYEIPFVKIACRPWVYPLIDTYDNWIVTVDHPHTGSMLTTLYNNVRIMYGMDEYTVAPEDYIMRFGHALSVGISDHTPGVDLFNIYQPAIYEKHFKLEDSIGLDSGPHAVTAEVLSTIL